ncbi:endogenous retrovirus group K member 8 Gag polyprotein-like [Prinia subflava]|uniref:endogenous retrovirus group K member 8 Gag polyprotein-like n=1 Tax=Prinia subflava TaxID=208062 RepID=UPI002FE114AA
MAPPTYPMSPPFVAAQTPPSVPPFSHADTPPTPAPWPALGAEPGTSPHPGRRPSWNGSSHAASSGSHGREPEDNSDGNQEVHLSAAPVTYRKARGGGEPKPNWQPFSQTIIRDLCKAHKEFGRESPYFRGLLQADLAAATTLPADLKQLFSCLMTPAEFELWLAAFRQALREELPHLPLPAIDEGGNPLTVELLGGEGSFESPQIQALLIPPAVLPRVRDLACKAFFTMQPRAPLPPFTQIRQGDTESFVDFVDKMTRALEIQVTDGLARKRILEEIVFANANNVCKQAILSLPPEPPRTLQVMLQVCQQKVPFLLQHMTTASKQGTRQVHAAEDATLRRPQARKPAASNPARARVECYLCHEKGHFVSQCPHNLLAKPRPQQEDSEHNSKN